MTDLSLFFGAFHPLIVHLPIGAAFVAVAFQVLGRIDRFAAVQAAVPWLYGVAALGATGAVLSGWALGGAPGASWDAHRWFGLGTAAGLVLATAATLRKATPAAASLGLGVACAGLIAWTGHLGGAITHGEEHFAQYAPEALREQRPTGREVLPANRDSLLAYAAVIRPMLDEHCVDCHRAGYAQGSLRLDSYAALAEGGSEGDARGLSGELWRRVTLDPEHARFMPSRGTPLSYDQLALLHDWLAAAPDSAATVADVAWGEAAYAAAERVYALNLRELPYIDRARPAAIEPPALKYWRALPVSQAHTTYEAHLRADADDPDAALAELSAIASNVVTLDLRRLRGTDEFLRKLPDMPHLVEVDLSRSDVTPAGVEGLARYPPPREQEALRDDGRRDRHRGWPTLRRALASRGRSARSTTAGRRGSRRRPRRRRAGS